MPEARNFYGWKLLAALSAIVSVNLGFTYVGASVTNAAMAKELNLSRSMLGAGGMAFVLAVGLAAPLAARAVNALGSRITLCLGSSLVGLAALLLGAWVGVGWQYVVCYGLLMGAGCAIGSMIPAQTCASMWFERRRALALALVLTGSGIGGSIAAPLLTRIIAVAGGNWRVAWYFVVAIAVAAVITAWRCVKNRPEELGQRPDGGPVSAAAQPAGARSAARSWVHRTRETWSVREAARTPALWIISLAAVGESAPSVAAITHAPLHLRDFGHTPQAIAGALSAFAILSIAGKLSVGFICDRIEPRFVWALCIAMMGSAVWVATHAQSTFMMYLFTGMLGFGSGAALTCWHATVANYFGPTAFASILGAQMPFSNAVSAASPLIVGMVYDRVGSYAAAFYAVGAFSMLAALLLLFARPPRRA